MASISIVGFGKLGSAMGAVFSEKGYKVICHDISTKLINKFKKKKIPFIEKNLSKLIKKNFDNLNFTSNIDKAINETSITFIVVPTPSKKNGEYSTDFVLDCLKKIAKSINQNKKKNMI